MALNKIQKAEFRENLEKQRTADVLELNKIQIEAKSRHYNQRRCIIRRQNEDAQEEAYCRLNENRIHKSRQLEMNERLAQELDKVKRQELKELKLRQLLRENTPELRELESQLRAAYVSKELAAQIAEKKAYHLQEKLQEKQAYGLLQNAWTLDEELRVKMAQKDLEKKAQYKQELQDQMILNEKINHGRYEKFLNEKKLIDDIIQGIHEEDAKAIEKKMLSMQKTRQEMYEFKAAQEMWRQRERDALEMENKRIEEYLKAKDIELQARDKETWRVEAMKAQISENIARQISEEQAKRKEREDLILRLNEAEQSEAIEQRHRNDIEKELRNRLEIRESLTNQMLEREQRLKQEAAEDAKYREQLMAKIAADERLEQLSAHKKRLKIMQLRKDVEQTIMDRRQKRAEEMQLLMKLKEQAELEADERKRMIEAERLRMLKEHAKHLIGYLPRNVLRADDLQHLGSDLCSSSSSNY